MSASPPPAPALPPADILIADDTPENLAVLRHLLVGAGYQVRAVLSGPQALTAANLRRPDLILLDIVMPGMDGYETCRLLQADAATREVPVLFISALDHSADIVRGFAEGAQDYLTKPFRPEEVLARVRTHLRLRQAQRQLARQYQELQEAGRIRDDVDNLLRHDLMSPLSAMVGLAEIIGEDERLPADVQRKARSIANSGQEMVEMMQLSLDVMKMERGTYRFDAQPVALAEMLSHLALGFSRLLASKRLTFEGMPENCAQAVVAGHPVLCRSLFGNLLKNAIEAAPEGSVISARCAVEGDQLALSLRNGGEVPVAIRGRMFEKFATAGKARGSGLGMYSARLMARTQGGDIAFDVSESGFTTITVRLPRGTPLANVAGPQAPTALAPWPPLRLLVAEDDDAVVEWLRLRLPVPPLEITWVETAREAARALAEQKFDVALIDLELPDRNGLEVAEHWQQLHPGQPLPARLVAWTGHRDGAQRERARQVGFATVLTKPSTANQLFDALTGSAPAVPEAVPAATDEQPDHVVVDADILPLVETFRRARLTDVATLQKAWTERDDRTLGPLLHRLQGSLAMYGFAVAADLARQAEAALQQRRAEELRLLLAELERHLTVATVAPAPAPTA